jgi:hypothetical protein
MRRSQSNQVPDRPRNHHTIANQTTIASTAAAQHPRNLPRHGRFFSHHHGVHHIRTYRSETMTFHKEHEARTEAATEA